MTKKVRNSVGSQKSNNGNLELKTIRPITSNQKLLFTLFNKFNYILSYGSAGVGKTLISLYLALQLLFEDNFNTYRNIVIVRSIVPTRDIGFLPGSLKEKSLMYEEPYEQIVNELYGRQDAYGILRQKNAINFFTTTALRGLTFKNCIIIIDEMQNMTDHEISSLITRMGDNVKLLMCGDGKQIDLNPRKEESGFHNFINICKQMSSVAMVKFTSDDIVRSQFVKEFIIAKENMLCAPSPGFGDSSPDFFRLNNGGSDDRKTQTTITTTT
jgi:phosphate starvation-inducible protein PhoH